MNSFAWGPRAFSLLFLIFSLVSFPIPGVSQVVIEERVPITPRDPPAGRNILETSGAVWVTPNAGKIIYIGGDPAAFTCDICHVVFLAPVVDTLCGDNRIDTLPGNWRAGTTVSMKLVVYPAYPYSYEVYPNAVDTTALNRGVFSFADYTWITEAMVIPGTDFDHFLVRVVSDTIAYGDSARITVTAVDHGGQEVQLDGNTQLAVSIDSTQFGSFLDPSGDQVQSPLSPVSYGDAKAGRMWFLANGSRNRIDSVWSTALRVVQTTDTTKSGAETVSIVDTVIHVIRTTDTLNVYPHYAGHNGTSGTRDSVGFDVMATFRGQPAANAWVSIPRTTLVVDGGHSSHSGTRPRAKFQYQQLPENPTWSVSDTAMAQTDRDGRLHVRFLASEFGGVEKVVAEFRSASASRDSICVLTRVPGLQLLPEGTNYVMTGGTCEHHGPSIKSLQDVPEACRTPNTDHFGTGSLLTAIRAIADTFALRFAGKRITVNDLSLPYGGGFDIPGGWQEDVDAHCGQRGRGHCGHREGKNADLPFSYVDAQGGVWPMSNLQQRRLRETVKQLYGDPYPHSDHLHLQ